MFHVYQSDRVQYVNHDSSRSIVTSIVNKPWLMNSGIEIKIFGRRYVTLGIQHQSSPSGDQHWTRTIFSSFTLTSMCKSIISFIFSLATESISIVSSFYFIKVRCSYIIFQLFILSKNWIHVLVFDSKYFFKSQAQNGSTICHFIIVLPHFCLRIGKESSATLSVIKLHFVFSVHSHFTLHSK